MFHCIYRNNVDSCRIGSHHLDACAADLRSLHDADPLRGDIVVSVKGSNFEPGDLVAFYLGNKILVKRCIAGSGQWVNIDENGNAYVDGELLDEPYLTDKALGDCNIDLPYQVPDNRYFCMGDHRSASVDSRHTNIGCIADEQIVGKIVFRIWPIADFGALK